MIPDTSEGSARCLAHAIVEMQFLRNALDKNPEVLFHEEWIHVLDNHPTIHSDVSIKGHIKDCECGLAVGVTGDTNDI